MSHDPLLQYEQHTRIIPKKHSFLFRLFKFCFLYLMLTGGIFVCLMGLLNFSAYSAVITNWVNPDLLLSQQDDIESALSSSSVAVHALDSIDTTDSLQILTQKVALTDPDMIYSRSYGARHLLSGISDSSTEVSFDVTPYENRIIIPKLGKNIPLVDVEHDTNAKYGEMQDVFMEELKK